MTASDKGIKPSVGDIDTRDCVSNFCKLVRMGYRGANLHIDDFVIPEIRINSFKQEHAIFSVCKSSDMR